MSKKNNQTKKLLSAFILAIISLVSIWTIPNSNIKNVLGLVNADTQLAKAGGSWPLRADIYPSTYSYKLSKTIKTKLNSLNPNTNRNDVSRIDFEYSKSNKIKREVTKSRDDTSEIDPDDIDYSKETYNKKESLPGFYQKTYGKSYIDQNCVLNFIDKTASKFTYSADDRNGPVTKKTFGNDAISSCAEAMQSYPPSDLLLGGGSLNGDAIIGDTTTYIDISARSTYDFLIRDNRLNSGNKTFTVKIHLSGDKVVLDKSDNKITTKVERPLMCSEMKMSIVSFFGTVMYSGTSKQDGPDKSGRQDCIVLFKISDSDDIILRPKTIEVTSTVPAYNTNVWITDPKKDIVLSVYKP